MARNSRKFRAPIISMKFFYVLAILIPGCSGAIDYSKSIGDLKTAIDSSITTISAIDAKETNRKNEIWRNEIVAGTALLEGKEKSCAVGEGGCSLQVRHAGEKGIDFPLTSVLIKSRAGLTALKSYVASLKAIADADTANKIAVQTNQAIVSLTKIETEVAKANQKDPKKGLITAYSEPIGRLLNWSVEQFVESIKSDALATATKRAHPAIIGLNDLMTTIGKSAAIVAFSNAQKEFLAKKEIFDAAGDSGGITKAVVSDYVKAVTTYDQALKASAAEPLAAFTTAHEKLMKHLNNEGDISLADALAAIDNLKMKAKEFKTLIDGITEVSS